MVDRRRASKNATSHSLVRWFGPKRQIEGGCRNTADEETNGLRGDQSGNLGSGTCALQREDKRPAGVRVIDSTNREAGEYSRSHSEPLADGDQDPIAALAVYLLEEYVVQTPSTKKTPRPQRFTPGSSIQLSRPEARNYL
jgi:hypothetical protein